MASGGCLNDGPSVSLPYPARVKPRPAGSPVSDPAHRVCTIGNTGRLAVRLRRATACCRSAAAALATGAIPVARAAAAAGCPLVGHGAGCLRGCVSVFGAGESGLARPAGKLCRPKSPVAPPHMSIRLSRVRGGAWESPCLRRLMLWHGRRHVWDERMFSLRMTVTCQ